MSEYQYYECCNLNAPLSQIARKTMASLSSRAKIGTHGASYVYHFGDFRGNPKQPLLKYFDVFFYIANWGTVKLMFKYFLNEVDVNKLKNYCIKDVIRGKQDTRYVLLELYLHKEEGWGWIEDEGEGKLPDILPLYDEIKQKNYKFLSLVSAVNNEFSDEKENSLCKVVTSSCKLLYSRPSALDKARMLIFFKACNCCSNSNLRGVSTFINIKLFSKRNVSIGVFSFSPFS